MKRADYDNFIQDEKGLQNHWANEAITEHNENHPPDGLFSSMKRPTNDNFIQDKKDYGIIGSNDVDTLC
jgi:hypothetical protein